MPDGVSLVTLSSSNIPYPDDTIKDGQYLLINTPGAVYDGYRFNHIVKVQAPGVTIRNSYFAGLDGNPANTALLMINDTNTSDTQIAGALVEDSTFIPRKPSYTVDGVRGSNFTLRRVEITNTVDGVHVYGPTQGRTDPNAGNVIVERSWVHDLAFFEDDPNHSDGTHNDGVQIVGGGNVTLLANRLDGKLRNAAIQVNQNWNDVWNLTVVGNYLANGMCTVNIDDSKGSGAIEGVAISLNVFARGTSYYEDCADIITDPTYAITTARYDFWDDLSDPAPISIDGDSKSGWESRGDRLVNKSFPTNSRWNEQFGANAPLPNVDEEAPTDVP